MTPNKFLAIVRARWSLVMLIVLVTTASAFGLSLVWPKKYVAEASVVIDAKPDPISAVIYPGMASPAFVNTQVDVLQSDRVALRVIRDLHLVDDPQLRAKWQRATDGEGSMEQWLTQVLEGSMDVKPSKESNVLVVTYKAPSAALATRLANAYLKAYVETAVELQSDPAKQYASYFQEQSRAAQQRYEDAKSRLSEFEEKNGITSSDERVDVETERLNELSAQLVGLQAQSADSSSRRAQAAAGADHLPDVLANPVVMQLKADLGRAESHLKELTSQYGDNHPQVIQAKAAVDAQRARLAQETGRVTGGVTSSDTINRTREADIRAQLDAQRDKVLKMKAARDQSAVLQHEVDTAQKAYESINARLTQTSLEGGSMQSNVLMLSEATEPLHPASPRVALNTALAFVAGLILAVGAVLLLEISDRRIREVRDLVLVLELPVLGVLPAPASHRSLQGRRALERRLLRGTAAGSGSA